MTPAEKKRIELNNFLKEAVHELDDEIKKAKTTNSVEHINRKVLEKVLLLDKKIEELE